jgi:uncharacterized integral membrane protein
MRLRRPSGDAVEQWQPRLWFLLVGLLAILAYVFAFVVKNDDEIQIDFVFFTATISLIWEILLMLGIGVLCGVLLSQLSRRRRRDEPR